MFLTFKIQPLPKWTKSLLSCSYSLLEYRGIKVNVDKNLLDVAYIYSNMSHASNQDCGEAKR